MTVVRDTLMSHELPSVSKTLQILYQQKKFSIQWRFITIHLKRIDGRVRILCLGVGMRG